mgnify:CR=1 FL=1
MKHVKRTEYWTTERQTAQRHRDDLADFHAQWKRVTTARSQSGDIDDVPPSGHSQHNRAVSAQG